MYNKYEVANFNKHQKIKFKLCLKLFNSLRIWNVDFPSINISEYVN